jgi:PAS domain S-box-containing protein
MTPNYAYAPAIWPALFTILFLMVLAGFSWHRRTVPGALMFMFSCLFAGLATVGLVMMYLATGFEAKVFWFKFEYSWMLPSATATTCFILEYTWPGRWLNRRSLALLAIMPLLALVTIWTNGFFSLAPPSFTAGETVRGVLGPTGTLLFAYAFVLSLINLAAFAWLFSRSPSHRWPVVLMAIGQISTRLLLIQGNYQLDALVFVVPAFVVPYLAYAVALFSFRIFDPLPLARKTAIEQLHAGMLVLDQQGQVISLNSAAERILGISMRQARGKLAGEVLPDYIDDPAAVTDGIHTEVSLGSGQKARTCTLTISALKDFRGLAVGRLMLLTDVTEQKRAQALILEQQRVMATQNERERMARELHDSLGQVLSYTNLQVETALKLFQLGQGEDAAAQLHRLGGVVREGHADLREYILNLHSTASLQQPFFVTVDKYLDGYTCSYNIQTHLAVDSHLGEHPFSPETQLQVFRILQEALSNARKHGQARQVQVVFAREDGRARMTIQDDGCGFAPEEVLVSGEAHFGLRFMQERARQLEGSLLIQSSPGAGTQVLLDVPVGSRR